MTDYNEDKSDPRDPIQYLEPTHDTFSHARRESIDILSNSLDIMVKSESPSTAMMYRKESDASALLVMAGIRKESDSSALYSLTSLRKDSDASALSAMVRDEEEEMMQQEEAMINAMSSDRLRSNSFDHRSRSNSFDQRSRSNSLFIPMRKDSDPLENLRKLSDTSDAVSALRKLSDGTLGEVALGDFKSPESSELFIGDMKIRGDDMSKDDGSVHLFENPIHPPMKVEPTPVLQKSSTLNSKALEHLDALGSEKESNDGSQSTVTLNDANQKMLMDALLGTSRRNRAESWGGMSDISAHQAALVSNLAAAANILTADIHREPSPHGFEGVIMSPRSQSQDSLTGHLHQHEHKAKRRSESIDMMDIPEKIGLPLGIKERERLDSLTDLIMPSPRGGGRDRVLSFSERNLSFSRDRLDSWAPRDRLDPIATRDRLDSLANLSGIFSKGRDRLDSLASLGEVSLTMSIGDLEDVAGKLELAMNEDSDMGESSSEMSTKNHGKGSLPAPTIQVDSEAVQSAVLAAMAATSGGILDMLQINTPHKMGQSKSGGRINPMDTTPLTSNLKNGSMHDPMMDDVRAKARAAAGYIHPAIHPAMNSKFKSKKRPLPTSLSHAMMKKPCLPTHFSTHIATPKLANGAKVPSGVHMYSDFSGATPKRKNHTSLKPSSSSKGGQSNQKWEEMFDCLVAYVKDQRGKEIQGLSEEDEKNWEWTGNVPTMYKTSDGKALGRWINNQRSAKSKGSLKADREERLIGTGLKWSVLTTNAWTDMMEELKVYVDEKTKEGKKWDGNVPTNYKIRTKGDNDEGDEDKNLGRWINRQRSLYQSGKLKEDRRLQLEELGLKWAVLSTTSWHTMYDALCRYALSKRATDENGHWDGNVPASYETDDKPPKKLGRWINRQRSAFANKKLKNEFIEKLEKAGLKWTANDSKKEIETDVLMRQRVLAQSQRGPVPQIIRSGIPGTHLSVPGARPGVASLVVRAPGTAPRVIPNAVKSSATLLQKGHLSIVSKVGAQKVVLPARAVASGQGVRSKVIIPARYAQGSGSKIIIPARSLAQHAAAARSAGSASKVIIPARSLTQIAGNVTKVVVPSRSAAQMQMATNRVVVPTRSAAPNQLVSTKTFLPQKTTVTSSNVVGPGTVAAAKSIPTKMTASTIPVTAASMSAPQMKPMVNNVHKSASNPTIPTLAKPTQVERRASVPNKISIRAPIISKEPSAPPSVQQALIKPEQVHTTTTVTSVRAPPPVSSVVNTPQPQVAVNVSSSSIPVKTEQTPSSTSTA